MKPEHRDELLAYAIPLAILVLVLMLRYCEGSG